ncbi:MAG: hypothetical protein HRT41_12905 [Campylobacteraceae bacterium]|nr:hypothetical protein [Campylobacteraceae bacterium]
MNILEEIEELLKDFNHNTNEEFNIDSIRITFNKRYKINKIKNSGNWKKLQKNSNILNKLKRRLSDSQITSVYKLEEQNIYFFNSSTPPKYNQATLVIFGMKQYHKEPPPRKTITKLLKIVKDITNIDLCVDLTSKPNIRALEQYFNLNQYIVPTNGIITDTHYINQTNYTMIEKIIIYNKALKNNLSLPLWRIEAKISIPNIKYLALPLSEFKEIIDIARIKE